MFIKQSIFKKLINASFKGKGLTIGHVMDKNAYVITSGWWMIWILKDFLPNKEKAMLIELVGELPTEGQIIQMTKDGWQQYEFETCRIFDLPTRFRMAKTEFFVTSMLHENKGTLKRILQEEKTGDIRLIHNMIVDAVELGLPDKENGETEAVGPVTDDGELMIWGSNVCYLATTKWLASDKQKIFWDSLSALSIPE